MQDIKYASFLNYIENDIEATEGYYTNVYSEKQMQEFVDKLYPLIKDTDFEHRKLMIILTVLITYIKDAYNYIEYKGVYGNSNISKYNILKLYACFVCLVYEVPKRITKVYDLKIFGKVEILILHLTSYSKLWSNAVLGITDTDYFKIYKTLQTKFKEDRVFLKEDTIYNSFNSIVKEYNRRFTQ